MGTVKAAVKASREESVETLIRRFNKEVQKSGILTELKKREFYEKPSVQRKRRLSQKRKKIEKFKKYDQ
ncbi:30S ribosomal protein S21 [candidate division WWE3 bacterium CG06_land_8_20_14_3_00_42_16]|uniref:Small ribosomal subunit protein bS21 n=4 Tax=Katanobacteria TaxID=422282 RepID=A0A2M7ALD5_UNCKA|nr:MAG: 30S ribosomal protein S21 [bacterium CG1_02_42_9]PIU68193.1 MAG: 30S ribosomal protein S21 [candidate division WWE3 bacterium CG06_land_8_20_14_3_00_42_16]PIZ43641.1 MAG: 30S ribosomal protein S21 [candidate division WWE3 bacterium CG_4_10_14_0_2_um_filter_42_8]PJA38495.1 MAG: 30S ribosomal protein S21 [candidate division WWE3 bacterium CG_4_9_14_3_um_filter_43_9]PJC68384.1 MAG: 30S ribosomal protein S21 [candidate division WWE3 bacterium CG_4_8_14_3_um_filter_42_11]